MAPGSFFKRLKESVQTEDLNRRIYNIFLIVGILFFPLSAVGNFFQGLHIIAVINPLVSALIMAILFYLSVKKNLMRQFLFCLVILVFTSVQWIYNGGGSSGGMQYFVLWTFIMATVMLRKRKLVVFVVLNAIVLLGLLIYEHLDGSLIVQYSDKTSRLLDIIVSASLTFLLASYTIHVIYSEINRERAKSDKLLLNILPPKIIKELKEKGTTSPETFQNVTVLFSDFVGFTDLTTKIPVNILIAELNDLFTTFDSIIERHSCERIKTIGDAYLAVCGLPESNADHCRNIIDAAEEMIQYLKIRNTTSSIKWQIRIGIHTGSVIGSVVGIKKYIYDIFGDTVNTASRLESLSEPMKINISKDVMNVLDGAYSFEDRGLIEVKGKDEMQMYFVSPGVPLL